MQKFLRDIDNTMIINSLKDCPHTITLSHSHTPAHTTIIRRDVFRGYMTRGKKKVRTYHVILTPDHVIYTRVRGKGQTLVYEFAESLKVCFIFIQNVCDV